MAGWVSPAWAGTRNPASAASLRTGIRPTDRSGPWHAGHVTSGRGGVGRRDIRFLLDRLPAGDAGLQVMPEPDLVFSQSPAKEDLLVLAPGGEIDQPLVHV